MKSKIIPVIAVFLMIQSCIVYSQNQNDVNKIIPGKKYKIVLFDDSEIMGKVISVDSVNVVVQNEYKTTVIIPKNNILYYSTNLTPSIYNLSVSLLGGPCFFAGNNTFTGYQNKIKPGINFNLAGIFYISDTKAIKIDAGYTYLKPDYEDYYYASDAGHPSTYEGGDISQFLAKGNILIGSFNPSQRLMVYASLGFGIHYMSQKSSTYTYWYRNYEDTTWNKSTESRQSQSYVNALLSVGAALGYRVTSRFGIMGEIEYNLISNEGIIFWSSSSYFPVRLGVYYNF